MKNKRELWIGDVARICNVSTQTIRFYEKKGIISPIKRKEGGNYRVFSRGVIKTVKFVKKGQLLGFTLDEIKEIIQISNSGKPPCKHVISLIRKKIEETEKRILEEMRHKRYLERIIKKWRGRKPSKCKGKICEIVEKQ